MEEKTYSQQVEETRNLVGNLCWAQRKGDWELMEKINKEILGYVQTPEDAEKYTSILKGVSYN